MLQSNTIEDIGKRIRHFREKNGETQQELANELGVKRETVNQWENGTRDLKTQYTVILADHFGVTCDDILRGVKSENIDINKKTGLIDEAINRLDSFKKIDEMMKTRKMADGLEAGFGVMDTINYLLSRTYFGQLGGFEDTKIEEAVYKDFDFFMLIDKYLNTTDEELKNLRFLNTSEANPIKLDSNNVYGDWSLEDKLYIGNFAYSPTSLLNLVLMEIQDKLKEYRNERQNEMKNQ